VEGECGADEHPFRGHEAGTQHIIPKMARACHVPAAPGLRLHKNNQITSKRAVVVDIRLELPCHCQEQQLNNEARDNQLRSIFIPTNRRPLTPQPTIITTAPSHRSRHKCLHPALTPRPWVRRTPQTRPTALASDVNATMALSIQRRSHVIVIPHRHGGNRRIRLDL